MRSMSPLPEHRLGGEVGGRSFDHEPDGALGALTAQDDVHRFGGSG
jgi:hypothetical protein